MAIYQEFEDLPLWQEARELVRIIYNCTSRNKFVRDYGLKYQIQRSAVSIMTNIAEGFERRSNKEFRHSLNYAKASPGEKRTLVRVALDQRYTKEEEFRDIRGKATFLSKSISGFDRYLSQSNR